MDKNVKPKEKGNLIIKIITTLLVLFAFLCIFLVINNKSYSLIFGIVGIVLLIITMNIANAIKFSKDKVKLVSIISLILTLLSIPLMFKQIIFSYVLVVPAFILSKKAMKKDSRSIITKIAFILSLVMLILYLAFSIIGGFMNVSQNSKI
ncbi:MAG: hypothetical protein ACI4ON_03965 [Clostridia bacterium]